jgi:adenosylcobinamide-GDP ribazoletransferase
MHENDPAARPMDIVVGLSLLTRLPLRLSEADYARGARTAWAWPLVGVVVAGVASAVALILGRIGYGYEITSLIALATMIVITGAMHEDGLADCADGFWGGHDPARRLDIMKDSRIGAYGVLALILSLGLRWAALVALARLGLLVPALLVSAVLSRAAMVAVMQALPNARSAGLSHQTGRPGPTATRLAVAIAVVLALLLGGWACVWAALWVALAGFAAARLARAKIGGQTGDVLGASQQLTEITALLVLLAAN